MLPPDVVEGENGLGVGVVHDAGHVDVGEADLPVVQLNVAGRLWKAERANDEKIAIQVAITTRGAPQDFSISHWWERNERCKRSFSSFHSHFVFLSVSLILHYDVGSFSDLVFKSWVLDIMSEEQMAEDHCVRLRPVSHIDHSMRAIHFLSFLITLPPRNF